MSEGKHNAQSSELDIAVIKEGAPFAALSYILFLWLIAFILKRENEFAHYHARQGLVVFIGWIVAPFFTLIPILGELLYTLSLLGLLCVSLYGIYSALTGKLCKIPLVTDIASKLVI